MSFEVQPIAIRCHRRSKKSLCHILKARRDALQDPQAAKVGSLQRTIIQLLTKHQDIDKLLQEIQASKSSEICHNGCKDTYMDAEGTKVQCDDKVYASNILGDLGVQSVTSCLQQQAALTSLPISQLAAKKFAVLLTDIIIASGQKHDLEHGKSCQIQREEIEQVIGLLKGLAPQNIFHRQHFAEALASQCLRNGVTVPLELLWLLHQETVMPLDLYLKHGCGIKGHHPSQSSIATDLTRLVAESWKVTDEDADAQKAQEMFIGIVTHLMKHVYMGNDLESSDDDRKAMKKVMQDILDNIMKGLFVAACDAPSLSDESPERILPMAGIQRLVPGECSKRFAAHHISQLLCHNPVISVTDAFSRQHEWSFGKSAQGCTSLFRQLLLALHENDAVGLLKRALDNEEVNWQSTLTYASTLLVYFPTAQNHFQKCLRDFTELAMQDQEEEPLICAFLLVRQAANEGPHVFPSYASWFKETFSPSPSSGLAVASKRAFTFLLEFLTNLVPHETATALKAHVQNPPSAPPKSQDVLKDYILLAKTRLSDLNESWQSVGLPGVSVPAVAGSRSANPKDQASSDVEFAVESYQQNERIPTRILEVSIFRRPYYITYFLPALLKPRVLPDVADEKMKLIGALKSANKIPSALMQQYEQACAKELNELLDGAFSEDALDDCLEPVDALRAGLAKLQSCVGTSRGTGSTPLGEVTAQVTLLADRVAGALGLETPPSQSLSELSSSTRCVEFMEDKHSTAHKQVAEVILDSFISICRASHLLEQAPSSSSSTSGGMSMATATTEMSWAHQLVAMLSRFTELCSALCHRVWTLVCQQCATMTTDAIIGTSCFLIFSHVLKSSFPPVILPSSTGQPKSSCTLLEAVSCALSLGSSQQMMFSTRFISVLLHHSLSYVKAQEATRGSSSGIPAVILPIAAVQKFCFLLPRVCPEMREEMGDAGMEIMDDDILLAVGKAVYSSQNFHKVLPEDQSVMLSFQQWIVYELQVVPHEDALRDLERHDYHRWAVVCHFLPLPESQGGCGGSHGRACAALIHGLMDHETRAVRTADADGPKTDVHGTTASREDRPPSVHRCHDNLHSCWRELVQTLQELITGMELDQVDQHVSGDLESHDSWLLCVLHERLAEADRSSFEDTCFTPEAVEIQAFVRIMCCLPLHLLFTSRLDRSLSQESLRGVAEFVNNHLRRHCMESWCSLPYVITAHFTMGLLLLNQKKIGDAIIGPFLLSCPLLVASIVHHWGRLQPYLVQAETKRPLPEIFQHLKRLYTICQDIAESIPDHRSLQSSSSSSSASSSSSSSSSSLKMAQTAAGLTALTDGVSMATPPWVIAVTIYSSVRSRFKNADQHQAVVAAMQIVIGKGRNICVGLLECLLADEAWNVIIGKQADRGLPLSQLILQHLPLLLQLMQQDSCEIHDRIAPESASQLVPLVILRGFQSLRSQMPGLLSQHPQLLDGLLASHNALGELYCRAGVELPQPQRGIRKLFRSNKGEVLSADFLLSCTRFLLHCIAACPPATLHGVRPETLAGCNGELQASLRQHAQQQQQQQFPGPRR